MVLLVKHAGWMHGAGGPQVTPVFVWWGQCCGGAKLSTHLSPHAVPQVLLPVTPGRAALAQCGGGEAGPGGATHCFLQQEHSLQPSGNAEESWQCLHSGAARQQVLGCTQVWVLSASTSACDSIPSCVGTAAANPPPPPPPLPPHLPQRLELLVRLV